MGMSMSLKRAWRSMPAPQSQASLRLLKPRQGFSGWLSQTDPLSSQNKHALAIVGTFVGYGSFHTIEFVASA